MRNSGPGIVQQPRIVILHNAMVVGELTVGLIGEDPMIAKLEVVGALSDMPVPL
jgi:hypothetical protein